MIRRNKRRLGVSIGKDEYKRYSFDENLARHFGLHQALILTELHKIGAYTGPGGEGWVELSDYDWVKLLPFLSLLDINQAIKSLVEQDVILQDIQWPLDSWEWKYVTSSDDIDVLYLIHPEYVFRKDQQDRDRSGSVYLFWSGEFYKIGQTARKITSVSKNCRLSQGVVFFSSVIWM
jgi:hypothetical protein